MVDFVFVSFGLLAVFALAMAIITNLYLRTVMTNAATEAARLLARADISSGCDGTDSSNEVAISRARESIASLVGSSLATTVQAHIQRDHRFCSSQVTIATNLPGFPLVQGITRFEASAHATLEIQ